jgi:predicted O-linked N-acetylglucosamine transferase (SPINDLY family)
MTEPSLLPKAARTLATGHVSAPFQVAQVTAQALCRDGSALLGSGDLAGALACFEAALAQEPDFDFASLCRVHALSCSVDCVPQQYLQAARAHGARLATVAVPYGDWSLPYVPTAECSADAPLRVGLVSGNFHEHPVGYFLESLVQALSPHRAGARPSVQLFAYDNRSDEDALTARLRPDFTHWETIVGADDAWVARKIHSHGLHVLIDLDGYTDGNRLGVFAWRPAPLQLSWLGYWASTGLDAIDAVLADEVGLPPALEGQFSEAIGRMPHSRLCYSPPVTRSPGLAFAPTVPPLPPASPLPALRSGYITFGCFQSPVKITNEALRTWGQVMQAVPGSRLRLVCRQSLNPTLAQAWALRLLAAGIAPGRVDLAPMESRRDYLASYADVDMVLDTFPATGGTTTCDALWSGVPTLTLAGHTLLARQGASLLCAAGLPGWVAVDQADFVRRAVAFAQDWPGLSTLRAGLREHVLTSPLMDATRFAVDWERALRDLWARKWPLPK